MEPTTDHRPFWTVILPVYDRVDYFREALASVLEQDPGAAVMQILVMDDASPHDDARKIVESTAPGRIDYFKQPKNLGLAGNWNSGIERSRGEWIHFLHSDDLLRPGFYEAMRGLIERFPQVGFACCSYQSIDETGTVLGTADLERPDPGLIDDWLQRMCRGQRLQCHSVVVRREVYDRVGFFRDDLFFTLDWEMWVRIAADGPMAYDPTPFAVYRVHQESVTGRLMKTGQAARDLYRAVDVMKPYLPAESRDQLVREARAWCGDAALRSVARLLSRGDRSAAHAQLRAALQEERSPRFLARAAWLSWWSAKVWIKQQIGYRQST